MTEGTVGFIGLGLMGQGFTRRLAGKGYRVVGFDIDAAKTRAASEWAVTPANSAGGAEAAIARVAPLLRDLGKMTHMGPVGTGQATKLVNQTLVLTNYCVLAEALRLAQAHGVDARKIPEALATGHAGSNLLAAVFPQMIAEDFAPRGFARQVLKDLEMLQAAARDRHLAMPMASQARASSTRRRL